MKYMFASVAVKIILDIVNDENSAYRFGKASELFLDRLLFNGLFLS